MESKLSERVHGLATGSAKPIIGSKETVGELYAYEVAYIRALQDVLEWAHDIEADLYGKRKPESGDEL